MSAEEWTPGEEPGPLLRLAWKKGRTERVTVTGADVVRVTTSVGVKALAILMQQGIPLGPVLYTDPRRAVEILVPEGTARTWPGLPLTRCVAGAAVRPPAPEVTTLTGRRTEGRTWFVPPGGEETATDPAALAEAIAEVQAEFGWAGHDREDDPETLAARLEEGRVDEYDVPASAPVIQARGDARPVSTAEPGPGSSTAPQVPYLGVTWTLPGRDPRTPAEARHRVADGCRLWRVPMVVADDLTLIVSELTANAVTHTDSAEIEVSLYLTGEQVSVAVTDQSTYRPLTARQAGADAENGRGLFLVEALAARWEILPTAHGTAVRAHLDLPPEHRVAPHTSEDDPDARP
ncbi:ATP-binding protein [Streptomyces scabiei]|uniref:ATP-binding protein n=1 Tax=Streptomyces scabiei TaxID=1930 RepID=UPI00298F0914|nr:ATP-binding protein [Streptomyces scabiei]MDW8478335.1 ATP-binding protein [Streptomyces scabiei]